MLLAFLSAFNVGFFSFCAFQGVDTLSQTILASVSLSVAVLTGLSAIVFEIQDMKKQMNLPT